MLMITTMRGPVMLLMVFLFYQGSNADTRYYIKLKDDDVTKIVPSGTTIKDIKDEKSRAIFNLDDESMIRDTLKANHERRNSFHETSTFDPDVLNKFLDEYANKMKSTTEKSVYTYPYHITTKQPTVNSLEVINNDDKGAATTSTEDTVTINDAEMSLEGLQTPNDTVKRNKYYNANSNDDRNGGWVTLEAIPWSKSKISKWQANPSSHQPWPDSKWDKPTSGKPWPDEQSSRPQYENKPWYDKPKPHWAEYQSDRPKPMSSSKPSYSNNRYESSSNQAQKWPPEKPEHSSWNDFSRPSSDIITDDRPSNFPTSNWDRYDQVSRPAYSSFNNKYNNNDDQGNDAGNDWPGLNYPNNKFENVQEKPSYMRPHNQRPIFSGQYEYESHYRPSHPSNGDGQWVLLSTNRGYSKARQRSIQFGDSNSGSIKPLNGTTIKLKKTDGTDSVIPVMTSKRQVRLTVLPSRNGTNTTTSHGGLLEVEKTFQTVDESQQEYEQSVKLTGSNANIVDKMRPLRHTAVRRPSNSAVLAAVGAGMLPATMAMVLPMMLGRKKRSAPEAFVHRDGWRYMDNIGLADELSHMHNIQLIKF